MHNETTLPIHPRTGLQALGVLPSGRIVWPILGAEDRPPGTGNGGPDGDPNGGERGREGGSGNDTGDGDGNKTFDQAAVDRIVSDRLQRERSKYSDYDRMKADSEELARLKESNATEQEKAINQARKDTEAAIRGQLEPSMNRLQAALKHGLPEELGAKILSASKRLVGDTPEELEADAKEFFSASPITTPTGAGNGSGGGRDLDQGTRGKSGSDKPSVSSGADLYAQRRGKKTT